jgi:penicillin-binding protein 2
VTPASLRYVDNALLGVPKQGTLAWKFPDFPLDRVRIRGKTGSAEVYGKQSTSWVATYDENYVVVMMISQGGTGSGTSGDAVRSIWEALYGVRDGVVRPASAAIPGTVPPDGLPTFAEDGAILPPSRSSRGRQ